MVTKASSRSSGDYYAPDLYERILAVGALILLAMVIIALARGYDAWHTIKPFT
jgi:hypothetical protein